MEFKLNKDGVYRNTLVLSPTFIESLDKNMQAGDIIFIQVTAKPFREVSIATDSWTNHVGIIVEIKNELGETEIRVAESKFPLSKYSTFEKFVKRSVGGRVAVKRLNLNISEKDKDALILATKERLRVFYDTGFNLYSKRQYCSKFVREVVFQVFGINLGKIEKFGEMLKKRPKTKLKFWKFWFFGNIPWERDTVTPASLLEHEGLITVFDGVVY